MWPWDRAIKKHEDHKHSEREKKEAAERLAKVEAGLRILKERMGLEEDGESN